MENISKKLEQKVLETLKTYDTTQVEDLIESLYTILSVANEYKNKMKEFEEEPKKSENEFDDLQLDFVEGFANDLGKVVVIVDPKAEEISTETYKDPEGSYIYFLTTPEVLVKSA